MPAGFFFLTSFVKFGLVGLSLVLSASDLPVCVNLGNLERHTHVLGNVVAGKRLQGVASARVDQGYSQGGRP